MNLLLQVYYGMVMLWPQARKQNVTALPVTAAQTHCISKSLNLAKRARGKALAGRR